MLLKRAGNPAKAVDVGFTFDDAVPAGGTPVTRVTASYPATKVQFTWNAAAGRWLAAMNGRKAMATEGGQLGGTTVIIQYVDRDEVDLPRLPRQLHPAVAQRRHGHRAGPAQRPVLDGDLVAAPAPPPAPPGPSAASRSRWRRARSGSLLINKKTPAKLG